MLKLFIGNNPYNVVLPDIAALPVNLLLMPFSILPLLYHLKIHPSFKFNEGFKVNHPNNLLGADKFNECEMLLL